LPDAMFGRSFHSDPFRREISTCSTESGTAKDYSQHRYKSPDTSKRGLLVASRVDGVCVCDVIDGTAKIVHVISKKFKIRSLRNFHLKTLSSSWPTDLRGKPVRREDI
jgi:hypothetical protein